MPLKELLLNLRCTLTGHRFVKSRQYTANVLKLRCERCKKDYFFHLETGTYYPWSTYNEKFYSEHQDPYYKTLNNHIYARRESKNAIRERDHLPAPQSESQSTAG